MRDRGMIPDQNPTTTRDIDRVAQEMYDRIPDADNSRTASPLTLGLEAPVTIQGMLNENAAFQTLHHPSENGLAQGMATGILTTISPLQHRQQINLLHLNARPLLYHRRKKPTARSQPSTLSSKHPQRWRSRSLILPLLANSQRKRTPSQTPQ